LKNKSQAQGGNGRHTHTLWDALKPNFAQAATRGEGGGEAKKEFKRNMDPNDLNPKIKQLQVRAPQKNVFPKAQPNLKIEIIKIKP